MADIDTNPAHLVGNLLDERCLLSTVRVSGPAGVLEAYWSQGNCVLVEPTGQRHENISIPSTARDNWVRLLQGTASMLDVAVCARLDPGPNLADATLRRPHGLRANELLEMFGDTGLDVSVEVRSLSSAPQARIVSLHSDATMGLYVTDGHGRNRRQLCRIDLSRVGDEALVASLLQTGRQWLLTDSEAACRKLEGFAR